MEHLMLRFLIILIISFILTMYIVDNDMDKAIGLTMTMTFFVTIVWESIRAIRNRN
jgi:hypothetical protein